ncbi:hypothetical protein KP509_30G011100 [Ceratopteris richardii]|uniref:Uncharacterized protein n=1 Tax=Ceratopteris richardii TaxID=49495 RepID=A0A8T2R002_CERRI|nr:hypothetical protein KP509_30G011100 [Ceratopteris richardii]
MAFSSQSPQRSLHPPDLHVHLTRLRKALTCSLCNQIFQKPVCYNCNHHFCQSCLLESMEVLSACPKCKQPAVACQARSAPDMYELVSIFQALEASAGPIVANSEGSQLENVFDARDVSFDVKTEDVCTLKRQRLCEIQGQVFCAVTCKIESENRRDDSLATPCRGVFPASKRIKVPCPPVMTDRNGALDENSDEKVGASIQISSCGQHECSDNPQSKNEAKNLCSSNHSVERVEVGNGAPYHLSNGHPMQNQPDTTEVCPANGKKQHTEGNERPTDVFPRADDNMQKVTCAFCHKSDSQVAGPMFHYKDGVFVNGSRRSGQVLDVHKNCAEWAPGVYFVEDVAKNIPQEIARGNKIKCHVCGLKGAVLGCYVKRCRKSFHYPCAHTLPCRWDDGNFLVLCPEHVSSRFPDEGSTGSSSKTINQFCKEEKVKPVVLDANGSDSLLNTALSASSIDAYIPKLPSELGGCNDEPLRQFPGSRWVLCASGLGHKANDLLATFASFFHLTVEKMWSSSVTHLIVGTDEVGAARRTFKYLMANLEGKWILKIDWLSACMAANRYVNEELYEINLDIHGLIGGPRHARGMAIAKVQRLFEDLKFYLLGEFAAAYRADLEAIVTAAGGLVLSKIPNSRDRVTKGFVILIYMKDMCPGTTIGFGDDLNKTRLNEARSLAETIGAKVAGHTWILDSVAAYEMHPFE